MIDKIKKVLFILPKDIGGAQKMTIVISQLLPKEQYNIKYLVVGKRNCTDMCYLINGQSNIEYLNILNAWDFLTLRLVKILHKEKPDIVFSSLMYLNIRVILAAKIIGGIKVIVRNDNMLKGIRKSMFLLLKLTYKKADVIIAQQEEMKKDLLLHLNLNKEKVVVRYNPIDEDNILKKASELSPYKDDKTIKYVWTGNFMPSGSKGQDILVRAFKLVRDKIPNAHLYLLGRSFESSQYFRDIKAYLVSNDLIENVHFVGFQENPYPWVKNADCFVLPSRIEGLPNALVDAMVLRKPVVATTCIPMISRMIENGYNGFLVPSEDYNAMAKAMIKALNLENFEMTYKPSTDKDFIELF